MKKLILFLLSALIITYYIMGKFLTPKQTPAHTSTPTSNIIQTLTPIQTTPTPLPIRTLIKPTPTPISTPSALNQSNIKPPPLKIKIPKVTPPEIKVTIPNPLI